MSETELRQIERTELDAHWPKAAPLIERALKYGDGDYTLGWVRQSLEDGQLCLLLADNLAVVATIHDRPARRVLFLVAVAGKLPPNWRDLLRAIEAWGKANGCTAIESHGRPGWQKKLPDYRARKIIYRKDI